MGDAAAALPDLERVVGKEPDYDFQRAAGLLAHAYALTARRKKRGVIPQGDGHFDFVGDLLEFRRSAASQKRNAKRASGRRRFSIKALDAGISPARSGRGSGGQGDAETGEGVREQQRWSCADTLQA